MTVLDKINREYPQMTRSEKALSAYVMAHSEEMGVSSIRELAEKNNVSTTTLIRYARRLGFEGFKEFRRAFCALAASQPTLTSKFEKVAALPGDRLLSDTLAQAFTCLEETFSHLSAEKLEQTVSLIDGARRVYCFGMKESFALAHYAYTRFYTVRDDSFLLNVAGGDVEQLLSVRPEDVCLVFLFHRYTRQALDILAALKKTGASVILFTNPPFDEVEPLTDVLLPCSVYGSGVKNTSIAPICLLDYLCNALAVKNSQRTLERFAELERLFEKQEMLGR